MAQIFHPLHKSQINGCIVTTHIRSSTVPNVVLILLYLSKQIRSFYPRTCLDYGVNGKFYTLDNYSQQVIDYFHI